MWIIDIAKLVSGVSDTVVRLPPPDALANEDHYFTAVSWARNDRVAVIWMNRHQVSNFIPIDNMIVYFLTLFIFLHCLFSYIII